MTEGETIKIQWGVIGTANIAKKNVRSIMLASNSTLSAIGSRDIDKARLFAVQNHLDSNVRLYGSYDQLLNDPNVQAVYMPLPTKLHLEWGIKVANAKKHLLIEKPVACNADELRQIVAACWRNGVIFMDGVMFMHHPRLHLLRTALRDSLAGEAKRVEAAFSFDGRGEFLKQDIRTKASGDPLGALGDLGWYTIRLGLIAYSRGRDKDLTGGGIVMPRRCSAKCKQWGEEGVPFECEAVCYFEDGSTLFFSNSFVLPFRQRFEIANTSNVTSAGDKLFTCDDFVIPRSRTQASFTMETSGGLSDCSLTAIGMTDVYRGDTSAAQQEVLMFQEFSRIAIQLDSKTGSPAEAASVAHDVKYWADIALATQLVIDACMISMKKGGEEVPVGDLRL